MVRNSHFIRLFFSSLLILFVIIVGSFIFLKFFLMDYVYTEIKKQDSEILFQIQQHMDSNIDAMNRIAHSLAINPGFTPFNLPGNPYKAM